MAEKHSSNSPIIDELLEGGFEPGILTTIYGPFASGKTNLCLLSISGNKNTLFIDTENSFSVERFKQLNENYEEMLKKVILLRPTDFEEQNKIFKKLKQLLPKNIGLIIVDSMTFLYRGAMSEAKTEQEKKHINNILNVQLNYLVKIARQKNIPVIITSQVYSDFNEKDKVNVVGGDSLKYASKCLIKQKKFSSFRTAEIVQHRSIKEGKKINFIITDRGIYRPDYE